MNNGNKFYIVVGFFDGTAHFLQMRGEINWFFYNNRLRTFKTKETAIRNANKVLARYNVTEVRVYLCSDGDYLSCSAFQKYDTSDKRIVYTRKKGETAHNFINQ